MKVARGAKNYLYPMPVALVGATVDGKPNYMPVAHVGIMDSGSISVSMNKAHYTNAGIKQNGTFSVNIPSADMVKLTDYCGLVSGKSVDKSVLLQHFYGELKTAPMIQGCPVNMECRLIQTVDFPRHDVFVGQIVATYCDEQSLTNGEIDLSKVQPVLFDMMSKSYWRLGERFAKAWNVGRELGKA